MLYLTSIGVGQSWRCHVTVREPFHPMSHPPLVPNGASVMCEVQRVYLEAVANYL